MEQKSDVQVISVLGPDFSWPPSNLFAGNRKVGGLDTWLGCSVVINPNTLRKREERMGIRTHYRVISILLLFSIAIIKTSNLFFSPLMIYMNPTFVLG